MRPWPLILLLLAGIGCEEDPSLPVPADPYLPLTSPENLVENLETAYRLRDIDEYARLLHPEFIYLSQPVDAQEIGQGFWTRDQDSTQVEALFSDPNVTDIRIELTYEAAVPIAPGADTVMIQVDAFLEIDVIEDGVRATRDQSGIWYLFLVREGDGDSTGWFLIEWRVMPS